MNKAILVLIRMYQNLSALFPSRCVYTPTCSEYAKSAFLKYPFFKAGKLTFWRILRCHPLAKGGVDPLR